MADNRAPDWGVIGAAAAGIATAIAAAVTTLRRNPSATPPTGTDRTEQTLDGVFKLVEQLQEELALKKSELDRLETRITEMRGTIADLERQIRAMGWPPPSNPPPELT